MPALSPEMEAVFHEFPEARARQHRGGNGSRKHGPAFTLKCFEEILLSTAPNYLVKGIIPRAGMIVVWGPPKCGKSFWVFDICMYIALGRIYRGRKVRQGSVVYLALEGGNGFPACKEAWWRRHPADHREPVPFSLLDVPVDFIADRDKVIESIRAQQCTPAVVVIDTLNRALNGDENNSQDMARFIQAADMIRAVFGCTVIIVHHCGINGNRPRGHTSLSGADDAEIAVDRDAADNVVATVEHMKDGEGGATIVSRLERVELGTDDDGDPITSCIIVPVEDAATKKPKLRGKAVDGLHALQECLADIGKPAPASNRILLDVTTVTLDAWKDYCEKTRRHKSEGPEKGQPPRAIPPTRCDTQKCRCHRHLGQQCLGRHIASQGRHIACT
jgi:hypothetical protein